MQIYTNIRYIHANIKIFIFLHVHIIYTVLLVFHKIAQIALHRFTHCWGTTSEGIRPAIPRGPILNGNVKWFYHKLSKCTLDSKTEDFATNVHDTLIHVTSKCSSVPSRWMHGQTLEFLAVQDMRIALRVPAVSHWEKLWFVEASGKISQSPQRALHWSCGSVCKLFPT